MEFDTLEELDEEWLELDPTVTRDSVLVCCATCGALNPLRRHTWRGSFLNECPTCRRKRQMRDMQRRRYRRLKDDIAKSEESSRKRDEERRSSLLRQIDPRIRRVSKQLEHYAVIKQDRALNTNQKRRELLYAAELSRLSFIRANIVRDLDNNSEKPFAYYMELINGDYPGRESEAEDQGNAE